MKSILCFGDSNTWGYNPITGERYPRDVRWPGRLQLELGTEYYVIEEGLNGRTTVWDDPIEEHKNGKIYLYPCLESHKPIDMVILMLGSNDLKARFSLSALDIASGAARLIDIIQRSQSGPGGKAPQILLLTPPPIGNLDITGKELFAGASNKVKRFSQLYKQVSNEYGCIFLDTSKIIQPSPIDGIHLEANAHKILAKHIAQSISNTSAC